MPNNDIMKNDYSRKILLNVAKTPFVVISSQLRRILYKYKPIKWKFSEIYRRRAFGGEESVSGPGSSLKETETIRRELPGLFKQFNIRSVLDAPCGDFNWFGKMEFDLQRYTGVDIVPELIAELNVKYSNANIRFIYLNILKDDLPEADLILCRDCFVHLSFKDISDVIKSFKISGAKYLLTTTFQKLTKNQDIITGLWRPINLQLSPFDLPEPIVVINENCHYAEGKYRDKSLALWKLEAL